MKTEIIKNNYGIFECFINDKHITPHIKKNKIFHETIFNWIKTYLCDGSFVDIGANIGAYSVCIAKQNKNSSIYAIEPHPEIFKVLNNNRLLNNLDNLILYNFAALHKHDTCFMSSLKDIPNFNTGDMRISNNKSTYEVNADRCDNHIKDTNISVIKIDTQGSDFFALKGCENIIDKCRPAIIIEWEATMAPSYLSINDVKSFLSKYEYSHIATYMSDLLFVNKANHDKD